MDARICLKRLYLNDIKAEEKKSQSADEWYVTEGYRAVNQALGRVLRHAKDFGVVALLDERFAKISKEYFPAWIRTSIKVFDKRFELLSSVSKFFDRRKGEIMPLASNGLIAKEREIPDTVKRRLSSTTTNYYEKENCLDYNLYLRPPCSLEHLTKNISAKNEYSEVTSILSICGDEISTECTSSSSMTGADNTVDFEVASTSEFNAQPLRKKLKLTRGTVDKLQVSTKRQPAFDIQSIPSGFDKVLQMTVKQYFNVLTSIGKKEKVAAFVMKFAKKQQTFDELLISLENELLPDYPEAFLDDILLLCFLFMLNVIEDEICLLGTYCILDNNDDKRRILQRSLSLRLEL
ncbi:hypothetical protein DICVIV_13520 [Dictyocaulus viviparus]|uniref:ATP-dependent helicase C-terminal domain-containing protein n=1 Tax=Dictyocaulus viviparus TaxID=29172 RepID=A0A0D8X9S6_DICVI|nr:hypothetical protein DICVIV_13520 [Dictyocaulus viviparus]